MEGIDVKMRKKNCWQFKNCGREPGGKKTSELGICPAATETRLNNINSGKNGGRACWAIAGTLCGGQVQGAYAQKLGNCLSCDFYKQVVQEEGKELIKTAAILKALSE
jgi:hypothetical protein